MRKCLNNLKFYGTNYEFISGIWIFDHGKYRGSCASRKRLICLFYKVCSKAGTPNLLYPAWYRKAGLPSKHQITLSYHCTCCKSFLLTDLPWLIFWIFKVHFLSPSTLFELHCNGQPPQNSWFTIKIPLFKGACQVEWPRNMTTEIFQLGKTTKSKCTFIVFSAEQMSTLSPFLQTLWRRQLHYIEGAGALSGSFLCFLPPSPLPTAYRKSPPSVWFQ